MVRSAGDFVQIVALMSAADGACDGRVVTGTEETAAAVKTTFASQCRRHKQ